MPSEFSRKQSLDRYLSGQSLYGDDFSAEDIRRWFEEEKEAYADLGARDRESYHYEYHELNRFHLFRHVAEREFSSALGIGSAYGDEFLPMAEKIEHISILEPSTALSSGGDILGTPSRWIEPSESGDLPFGDASFDLIVSLGALHHIPNVSHVMGECYRALARGGVMLVREPIVSMGDWSRPRHGVTKNERGIPKSVFLQIVKDAGFLIQHRSLCVFPLVPRLGKAVGTDAYNSRLLTLSDSLMSKIFCWNTRYHATSFWQKIRPTALALILSKD